MSGLLALFWVSMRRLWGIPVELLAKPCSVSSGRRLPPDSLLVPEDIRHGFLCASQAFLLGLSWRALHFGESSILL